MIFLHYSASITQLHSTVLDFGKKWWEKREEEVCKSIPFLVGRDMKMARRTLDQEENRRHEMGVQITEGSGNWELQLMKALASEKGEVKDTYIP